MENTASPRQGILTFVLVALALVAFAVLLFNSPLPTNLACQEAIESGDAAKIEWICVP